MPLIQKATEKAFHENIARLIKTEKRSRAQAVAIAYSIAKRAAAATGKTPAWLKRAEERYAAKPKKKGNGKKKAAKRSTLKPAKVVGLAAAMKTAKKKAKGGKKAKRPVAIKTHTFHVPKGLTRKAALARALKECKKRGLKKDFRGFTYDPKTGKATLT